jgi:hypothetical protein
MSSQTKTLEIPDGATGWSGEYLIQLDPEKKNTFIPHGMIDIPDLGLPKGDYYIKIVSYIIPNEKLSGDSPFE